MENEMGGSSKTNLGVRMEGESMQTSNKSDVSSQSYSNLDLDEVERAARKLTMNDSIGNNGDADEKAELITKLEVARTQSADEERLARKAAWIEESRKEVLRRKQFRKAEMLDVFPELVWDLILKKLEVSKDKAMMSNMNLLWRKSLKNERTTFLFQAVFQVLHEGGYFSKDTILGCRAVSRNWNRSVDGFLQNRLECLKGPEIEGLDLPGPASVEILQYTFILNGDGDEVAEFIERNAFSVNPFISRMVSLGFPPPLTFMPEYPVDFWNEVDNLIRLWGEEVWQALIFLDHCLDLTPAYWELNRFLRMMPNLKTLGVMGHDGIVDEFDYYDTRFPTKDDCEDPFERQIALRPLLELFQLKSIFVHNVPAALTKEILTRFGSTVETFAFTGINGNPNNLVGNINLPRLKRLFIGTDSLRLTDSKFSGKWPSIEEVRLMYLNLEGREIPKLFQCLSGLGGPLRKLLLSLHKAEGPLVKLEGGTLRKLSLELPLVEEFAMCVRRINLKRIDFLLPMRNLKVLIISYIKYVSSFGDKKRNKGNPKPCSSSTLEGEEAHEGLGDIHDEIIQFGNHTNRLYDSNIWKLFPELRKVTIIVVNKLKKKRQGGVNKDEEDVIKRKFYTREGYKQHCQENQDKI